MSSKNGAARGGLTTSAQRPSAAGFHLSYDLLLHVLRGDLPAELVDRQTRLHAVELCDICEAEWRAYSARDQDRAAPAAPVAPAAGVEPRPAVIPDDRDQVGLGDLPASEARLSRLREVARLARVDLSRLLRLPPRQWAQRVANARTRYRSRAFATLLIDEARQRLESAPDEAAALAALIPAVLDAKPGRKSLSWAKQLREQATAVQEEAMQRSGETAEGRAG